MPAGMNHWSYKTACKSEWQTNVQHFPMTWVDRKMYSDRFIHKMLGCKSDIYGRQQELKADARHNKGHYDMTEERWAELFKDKITLFFRIQKNLINKYNVLVL